MLHTSHLKVAYPWIRVFFPQSTDTDRVHFGTFAINKDLAYFTAIKVDELGSYSASISSWRYVSKDPFS